MDGSSEAREHSEVARRAFLRRGGLVAGGAAIGTAMAATGAGAQVTAQAIDYTYFAIDPVRVYDSRDPGKLGPLSAGQGRTLSTGLQTATPPPIAVTLNVAVTQTVGAGWLALFPGDATYGGTSSINWFGPNQDLANNAFVRIPADGTITVLAGGTAGAGANFIVDFIGASAGIDYSVVSTSGIHSLYSQSATWTEG